MEVADNSWLVHQEKSTKTFLTKIRYETFLSHRSFRHVTKKKLFGLKFPEYKF